MIVVGGCQIRRGVKSFLHSKIHRSILHSNGIFNVLQALVGMRFRDRRDLILHQTTGGREHLGRN